MGVLVEAKGIEISTVKEKKVLVSDLSYTLKKGEIIGIVGESGSGKSISCITLLGLLPKALKCSNGSLIYNNKEDKRVDLLSLGEKELRRIRANDVSMIFQEPLTALNPVLKCRKQLQECLKMAEIPKKFWDLESRKLLDEVNLLETDRILDSYPFELSGGQRQRVMIAMALASSPTLLIADEPTTALDVLVTKEIMILLQKLCMERGMSMVFVSHDLELVKGIAHKLLVMFNGEVMDYGITEDIINSPKSAYTKALMACVPTVDAKGQILPTISELVSELDGELVFHDYDVQTAPKVVVSEDEIIRVQDLEKKYPNKKAKGEFFIALNKVSLSVKRGECLGIVGASGSGKSTLAKALVNLEKPNSGSVTLILDGKERPVEAKTIQLVFQDPFSSLNPLLKVKDLLIEPILVNSICNSKKEAVIQAKEALLAVGLLESDMDKYPHEFSGGQRQRINVARALCLKPSIMVLDESVSALDVSVQAQVLNLLKKIQVDMGLTYVFITHDLNVAAYFCERIAVMNNGEIVEIKESIELFRNPETEYSKKLLHLD